MSILVTGGAGYIGSHAVAALVEAGEQVVTLDNLEKGHRSAVWEGAEYVEGDIRDAAFLGSVFSRFNVDSVMHFAGYSLVAESVADPAKYYDNNIGGTLSLLKAMNRANIKHIVFSSSASVYGAVESDEPIGEETPKMPINPYGETKLAIEKMLCWFDGAYGIKSVSLRYFNAAGAHASGKIGEDHDPETHLIPIVLQAAAGKREKVSIFGDDYNTRDGTCVRDYIHVTDLADAHILALNYLKNGGETDAYNLGSSRGFSVKQIIETAKIVTGSNIKTETAPRRAGDPATLIASCEKIKKLGFEPKLTNIGSIIESAWRWFSGKP